MPKIVSFTPIRNETDRYLQAFIKWTRPLVDFMFIWDDRSDDDSSRLDVAKYDIYDWGIDLIMLRLEDEPSFLENESRFRETGWRTMVRTADLRPGDYVLTLDADEFYVGLPPRDLAIETEEAGMEAVRFPIPEIFKLDPLSERTDGWWGAIYGTRMVRYREGSQTFPRRAMACGTLPEYAINAKRWPDLYEHGASILHYGYADEQDREDKYERYSKLSGHSSTHIESIRKVPDLAEWIGPEPEVWRGVR